MVQVWPNNFHRLDFNSATSKTEIDAANMKITTIYVSLYDLDLVLDLLYILFKFYVRLYMLIRARRKSARVCVFLRARVSEYIYVEQKNNKSGETRPKQ